MDITDIKLGMRVRTKLGKVGKVIEINRSEVVLELSDGEEYGAGFNCIEPEYTSGISIEDVRLGMPLVTSGGIQGKVVAISKEGGLWLETEDRMRFPVHVECVGPVSELGPGDTVRMVGKIKFLAVYGGTQCASVGWDDGNSSTIPVAHLVKCDDWMEYLRAPVDPCKNCQRMAELREARDGWKADAEVHARNADYWHDKFEKLQQESSLPAEHTFQIGQPVIFDDDRHGIISGFCEMGDHVPTATIIFGSGGIAWRALDDIKHDWTPIANWKESSKPLAEVAKCYKQVEPEQLLLSEDAKVVCEMLRANGPMTSHEISDRWCLSERVILECLLEAKEAGIVRLDDGKYSMVRD